MSRTFRNIAAVASKELRGYFVSPVAWVMLGLFALIFGWFFMVYLNVFNQQSLQAGGQPINVNMMLIRPLLSNASVLVLFLLPMITMRTYSEEKRSGTIELLLTSPLTDLEIIVGKFLGALGLYAAMLAVMQPHVAILFYYGNPEWRPLVSGYLGLFCSAPASSRWGCSSRARPRISGRRRRDVHRVFFWIINWFSESAGPTFGPILSYLSITEHLTISARA